MNKLVVGSLVFVGLLAGCASHKTATPPAIPAPAPATEPMTAGPYVPPAYTPPTAPPLTETPPTTPPEVVTTPAHPPVVKATTTKHTAHTAAVAVKGTKYVVKKGDTLSKIAQKKYGTVKAVKKILAANPGLDADLIKVGQTIILP